MRTPPHVQDVASAALQGRFGAAAAMQPLEVHIPYRLRFLERYGLVGGGTLRLARATPRAPRAEPWRGHSAWPAGPVLAGELPRPSRCLLELDAAVSAIVPLSATTAVAGPGRGDVRPEPARGLGGGARRLRRGLPPVPVGPRSAERAGRWHPVPSPALRRDPVPEGLPGERILAELHEAHADLSDATDVRPSEGESEPSTVS